MSEVVSAGGSVEDAINAATASFSDLYTEGYSAADAQTALTFALTDLSTEAGNAASALQETANAESQAVGAANELAGAQIDLQGAVGATTGGFEGLIGSLGMLGPAGAAAAATLLAVFNAVTENAAAFRDEEVSVVRYMGALQANIPNWQNYEATLDGVIQKSQLLGFSDDETRATLIRLFAITNDATESMRLLAAGQDLARFSGKGLEESTKAIAIAMETGVTRGLREYSIVLDKGASATEILAAVQQKAKGAALDYANTSAGAYDRMRLAHENSMEKVGEGSVDTASIVEHAGNVIWEGLGNVANAFVMVGDAAGGGGMKHAAELQKMIDDAAVASLEVEGSATNIAETWVNIFDDLSIQADAHAMAMGTLGLDSGENFGSGNADGMADTKPEIDAEIQAIQDAADIAATMASIGLFAGQEYGNELAGGIESAIPRIQNAVNEIIRLVNIAKLAAAEVAGIQAGRPGMGSTVAPVGGPVTGYTLPSGINPNQIVQPGASGYSNWLREQELERQRLADQATMDAANAPPKAGGGRGGGSKGGKGGKDTAAKEAAKAERELAAALREQEQALKALQAVADEWALDEAADRTAVALDNLVSVTATWDAYVDEAAQSVSDARDELAAMNEQAEGAQHSLNVEIRKTTQEIQKFEQEAADAYEPLQAAVDSARAKMDALSDAAAKQREVFQDLQDTLSDAASDIDARQTAAFQGPLAAVQALDDALYDLAQQERSELAPMDAAIRQRELALQAERKAIEDLAASYDADLIPLRQELADLDKEERQDTRNQTLRDQSVTVANLAAKLRGLVGGSVEYTQTQKELADAQRELGQSQERFSLEDRIGALEEEKQTAIDAANAQLAIHEEQLAAIQAEREARAYEFQQRREQMEAEREAINRRMELQQRIFDQEREILAAKQAALDLETETYNRNQRDLEANAATEVANAEAVLAAEVVKQEGRQELHRQYLLSLEVERERQAFNASEAARLKDAEIAGLTEKLNARKADATAAIENAKNLATAAKDEEAALRTVIEQRKDSEAYEKARSEYMAAYGVSAAAAETALASLRPHVAGMAADVTLAGQALNNDFAPAVQGLRDTTGPMVEEFYNDTWAYYFGTPESGGMGKITNILATHNPQGIWAFWESQIGLAFGDAGLAGKTSVAIGLYMDSVAADFNAEHATVGAATYDFGVSLLEGIGKGTADTIARTALAQDIADAVNAAIDEAKTKLGIESPSKVSGKEVGVPLAQGIIEDFNRTMQGFDMNVPVAYAGGRYRGSGGVGAGGGININLQGLTISMPNITNGSNLPTAKGSYKSVARTIVLDIADELRLQGLLQ